MINDVVDSTTVMIESFDPHSVEKPILVVGRDIKEALDIRDRLLTTYTSIKPNEIIATAADKLNIAISGFSTDRILIDPSVFEMNLDATNTALIEAVGNPFLKKNLLAPFNYGPKAEDLKPNTISENKESVWKKFFKKLGLS